MDRGGWWATVNGITKSRTRLSDWAGTWAKPLLGPLLSAAPTLASPDPLSFLSAPWEADPCSPKESWPLVLSWQLVANGRPQRESRGWAEAAAPRVWVFPPPLGLQVLLLQILLGLAVEGFLCLQPHFCLAVAPFSGLHPSLYPLDPCPLLHQSESFMAPLLAVLSGPHHPLWVPLFYFFGCVTHLGSWFPDQGSNPHPLHGKHRVTTIGPSGKSLGSFKCTHMSIKSPSFQLSPGTPSLSSGCYNIRPWVEGLQPQTFISHSSGGWKSKDRVPVDLVAHEDTFPSWWTAAFWLCPHTPFPPCVQRSLCFLFL